MNKQIYITIIGRYIYYYKIWHKIYSYAYEVTLANVTLYTQCWQFNEEIADISICVFNVLTIGVT